MMDNLKALAGDKKKIFIWLDIDHELHYSETLDDTLKELREIRGNLLMEDNRVNEGWNNGIADPGARYSCTGAFILICKKNDEVPKFDGYYNDGLAFFLEAYKVCAENGWKLIPLHLDMHPLDFEFECPNATVKDIYNGVTIRRVVSEQNDSYDINGICTGKEILCICQNPKVSIAGPIDEVLGNFMFDESPNSILVYARVMYPEYEVILPLHNAISDFYKASQIRAEIEDTCQEFTSRFRRSY